MKHCSIKTILAIGVVGMAVGCAEAPKFDVIPYPASVELQEGVFKVAGASIYADTLLDVESLHCIEAFTERLSLVTGRESEEAGEPAGRCISFILNADLAEEE